MLFTWERAMEKVFLWKERFADHYERYSFAKNYCKDKNVLDIASWSGYWSFALSHVAKQVHWLDVSSDAITYCKEHIKNKNLTFVLWDGKKIPFDDNTFDVVVSFETIEHIIDYDNFLKEIKRVLKKDWVLLMSTPNFKWEIVKNTYHVSNFTTESFVTAVKKHFNVHHIFYQGKHFYPFPGRGIFEALFNIRRDIKIHKNKPLYDHHVTLIEAGK